MAEDALVKKAQGAFITSLVRNNKTIREDRGRAILTDAQRLYKRQVEDMEYALDKLKQDRENMLDLSPTNSQSLVVASDFKAEDFVLKDKQLSLDIYNMEKAIAVVRNRYTYLFINAEEPVLEGGAD